MKYVREDREYSKAIRESIVQNDVQAFLEMRHIVQRVLLTYSHLYDFVIKNWQRFGRPVRAQYGMHG